MGRYYTGHVAPALRRLAAKLHSERSMGLDHVGDSIIEILDGRDVFFLRKDPDGE